MRAGGRRRSPPRVRARRRPGLRAGRPGTARPSRPPTCPNSSSDAPYSRLRAHPNARRAGATSGVVGFVPPSLGQAVMRVLRLVLAGAALVLILLVAGIWL